MISLRFVILGRSEGRTAKYAKKEYAKYAKYTVLMQKPHIRFARQLLYTVNPYNRRILYIC